mgnify:CR=1 FL=1
MSELTRRGFLRTGCRAAGLAGLTALGLHPSVPIHASKQSRPNIVLIYVDDVGWNHLSCYGHPLIETPNIDRLAEQGLRFTDAYSPAAVCSPSRCSLLTGQYVFRHGHYMVRPPEQWLGNLESKRPWKTRMQPPEWTSRLPLDKKTYGDALKKAGYRTGFYGKWHIGALYDEKHPKQHPNRRGFDDAVIHLMAGPYVKSSSERHFYPQFSLSPEQKVADGTYHGDLVSQQGVDFINRHKSGDPFFLMLSYFLVHLPFQAKKKAIDAYMKKYPNISRKHATFLAMHKHMDDGVGRITEALKKNGLDKNTIVIFTSDNGGLSHFGGNHPLKANKHMYWEGGIRVPMIVRWPGVIKPGTTTDEPVHQVDFFPTFMDLAGRKPPSDQTMDGVSLVPLLRSSGRKPLGRKNLFWHFPAYSVSRSGRSYTGYPWQRPCSIVRSGDFKLIEWLENGEVELYNLNADPGELNNVALIMPEKAAALTGLIHQWRKKNRVPMPVPR